MTPAMPSGLMMLLNVLKIANNWKKRILPKNAQRMVDCLNVA